MDMIKVVKSDNIIGGNSTMNADFAKLNIELTGKKVPVLDESGQNVLNWSGASSSENHSVPVSKTVEEFSDYGVNLLRNGDFSLDKYMWNLNPTVTVGEKEGKRAARVLYNERGATRKMFIQNLDSNHSYKQGQQYTLSASVYIDTTTNVPVENLTIEARNHYNGDLQSVATIDLTSLPKNTWLNVKQTGTTTLAGSESFVVLIGAFTADVHVTNVKLEYGSGKPQYQGHPLDYIASENYFDPEVFVNEAILDYAAENRYNKVFDLEPNTYYTIATNVSGSGDNYADVFATLGSEAISTAVNGVLTYGTKYITKRTGTDGKLKITYRNGSLDKIKSEEHKIWITKGTVPAVYQKSGKQAPTIESYYVRTMKGTSTTKLQVNVPTVADKYYQTSMEVLNIHQKPLYIGASSEYNEPFKTGEYKLWEDEYHNSSPASVGIILSTPLATDEVTAIVGNPKIISNESSPNLIPYNKRKFEGWNIGTGSQAVSYRVPEYVFNTSHKTNYFEFSTFTQSLTMTRGTVSVDNTNKTFTITATSDDAYTNTWTGNLRKIIKVKPSTKYTLSLTKDVTETTNVVVSFFTNDTVETHTGLTQTLNFPYTFTVPSGINYVSIRIGVGFTGKTVKFSNIGLYEGESAGSSLSPKDLHNASHPAVYNPASDQYTLIEKAPLEAFDDGYTRNLIKNSTWKSVHSNHSAQYPTKTEILKDKGQEFVRVQRIPSENKTFSVYNILTTTQVTQGNKVTISFKARASVNSTWQMMLRAYDYYGVSVNLTGDLSTVSLGTTWRDYKFVVEAPADFSPHGYRAIPYTPRDVSGSAIDTLALDLMDYKIEVGENPSPEYNLAWEDIPDAQKPATRIRTKGGTVEVKIYDDTQLYQTLPNGTYTHSIEVKNNSSKDFKLRLQPEYGWETINANARKSVSWKYPKTSNYMLGWRFATGITDELDVIAYNPQIKAVTNNEVLTTTNKDMTTWSYSEAAQTNLIPAPLYAVHDGYLRNLYFETGKSYNVTETHGTTSIGKFGRVSRQTQVNTVAFLNLNHLTVGKTYTFFADVCADQQTTWAGRAMYINTNTTTTHTGGTNITTSWQTVKGTFTFAAGEGMFHFYPNSTGVEGNKVYFSNFAIYEGTHAERPPYQKGWEDWALADKPATYNPNSGQTTLVERAPRDAFNSSYGRNLVSYGKGDSLTGVSHSADLDTSKTAVVTTESQPFIRMSHTALGYSRVVSWNTDGRTLQRLVTGKTYTLSFLARRSTTQSGTTNPYTGMELSGHYDNGTTTTQYFALNNYTVPNDGTWAKVTRTFTFTGDRSKDYIRLTLNFILRDVIGYMDIKEVKLEEGSVVTPYVKSWEELPNTDKSIFRIKTRGNSTRTAAYTIAHGLQKGGVYIPSATVKNIGDNRAYMQFAGQRTVNVHSGEMKDVSFMTTASGTSHWLSFLNEVPTHSLDLLISDISITKPDNVITFPIDLPAENRTLIMENISFTGTGPVHIVAGTQSHTFAEPTAFKEALLSNATVPNLSIAFSDDVSGYIGAIKLFKGHDVQEVISVPVQYLKETRRSNLEGWYVEGEFDIEDTEHLQQDYILMVPTKTKKLQPFRIHNKEVDNDVVKIYARHVVFDLANYIVPAQSFNDMLPVTVIDRAARTVLPHRSPFKISVTANTPISVQSKNHTTLEFIMEIVKAGGFKIDLDGFKMRIAGNLGKATDIPLMYGSNLEGVRILENFDNVVTTMYPMLSTGYMGPKVDAEVQYGKKYVKAQEIELEIPEEHASDTDWINEQLVEKAKQKLKFAQLPSISYVVTSSVPQDLELYDTVRVYHPAITSVYGNTNKEALYFPIVVAAYEYNVISELVESLQYGTEIYNTYALLTGSTQQLVEELEDKTESQIDTMQQMIDRQTVYINEKNRNGYIIIEENEIFAVDRLPKEEAVNVMRIGVGGIGMSSTGINGNFETAWSLEHGFNADFIRVGTLDADRIAAGSITVDHLSSTIGRDLNLTSNTSINFIVGNAVQPLQDVINSQSTTITETNNQLSALKTTVDSLGDNEDLLQRISEVETGTMAHDVAIAALEKYKTDSEGTLKAMKLDSNGLNIYTIDANGNPSEYRVVISERALEFKKGSTVVAYISGETLYISHAIVDKSIVIGSHHVESGSITTGRTIWRQIEKAT